MCGIVGYWNQKEEAFPILLESLKKLEYRGYDSFGFSVLSNDGDVNVEKRVGKVSNTVCETIPGKIGFGHTRWATHGKVTEKNTHPHKAGKIYVGHNGVIENFQELKELLLKKGNNFVSETDTEVIPHILEELTNEGISLKTAVMKTGALLKGRNAFIAINSRTGEMIAYRNGSPLIIGIISNVELFISSDIQAFLDKTKDVMYLDDNQIVVVKNNPEFYNAVTGERIEKRLITLDIDSSEAEKGDYTHFMLKEIMDQKETLARSINQNDSEILKVSNMINSARGVFFIGCGTAARVCHTAEYIFSEVADKHVNFIPASEFENYKHFLVPETLVVAVSQSGETADVLDALEVAKSKGSRIISIVNTQGSTIDRMSDYTFFINAGPEKAVASTKATTAQIAVLILLSYACAGRLREGDKELIDLAGKVNDMLNPRYGEHIRNLAEKICKKENIFIIGRGVNYPMSIESAIKIMEVSYIHAQGFAGGELKHGPIAMIEEGTPVIALVADDDVKQEIISNAIEVKSRGAYIIGVAPENNSAFDYWIKTPKVKGVASSIINIIPVQLLSYYLGIFRGHNVDYPRSLAKSVTVR